MSSWQMTHNRSNRGKGHWTSYVELGREWTIVGHLACVTLVELLMQELRINLILNKPFLWDLPDF